MKLVNIKRALLATSIIIFSFLTCYGQVAPSDRVVGRWAKLINGRTMTFTLSPDNKYQVEFAGDEETDVWGSYEILGDQITFNDEGGEYSADVAGVYTFKVDDTSLTFTIVNDPVTGRSMLLEGTWTKTGDD
jgi:hypothetical protein